MLRAVRSKLEPLPSNLTQGGAGERLRVKEKWSVRKSVVLEFKKKHSALPNLNFAKRDSKKYFFDFEKLKPGMTKNIFRPRTN